MTTSELCAIAAKAARRYKARCWWADTEDLEQEAMKNILLGRRTFDPTVGVPEPAYLWRVAVLSLRTYLWQNSAPVSETSAHLKELAGVFRAPMTAIETGEPPDIDDKLERARWHEEARTLLGFVFASDPDGVLAQRVLVGEEKPAAVASAADVSVSRVYAATQRARRRIVDDAAFYNLWETEDQ